MHRILLLLVFLAVGCSNVSRWPTVTPPLNRFAQIPIIMGTQNQINNHITSTKSLQLELLDRYRWDFADQAAQIHEAARASLSNSSNECGPLSADTVDYLAAGEHIGEQRSVQGRIINIRRSKRAVFLNFHDPYQGYFSGVIFISAWKQFPGRFEDLYQGQCVRINGTIKLYNHAPEIIIERPEQITLITLTN